MVQQIGERAARFGAQVNGSPRVQQARDRLLPFGLPTQAFGILAGFFILLKLVQPVIPTSVVMLYMGFALAGVVIHITLDNDRMEEFHRFFVSRLGEPRTLRVQRRGLLLVLPLLLGWWTYSAMAPSYSPPVEIFQRHPNPPESVAQMAVPDWAADPARWSREDIKKGEVLFKGNCAVCHGENLDGQGRAAEGFRSPIRPANFRDAGTISQLTLRYVFWRVSTGGIRNQFNSPMPSWVAPDGQTSTLHRYDLTSDEAWRVIMYLYAATGFQPRQEGGSERREGGH